MNIVDKFDELAFIKKLHGPPSEFRFNEKATITHNRPGALIREMDVFLPITDALISSRAHYAKASDLEKLSFLLSNIYGIHKTRVNFYPATTSESDLKLAVIPRRVIASGGACYPTNIYLSLQDESQNGYFFRYFPSFHALSVEAATKLSDKATLFFTVQFNRTVPKYKSFAYRLTAVDNGLVLARSLFLLNSLEIPAQLIFDCDQLQYEKSLSLDTAEESLYAMIHLDNNFFCQSVKPNSNEVFERQENPLPYEIASMDQICRSTPSTSKTSNFILHSQEPLYSLESLIQTICNRASRANYFSGHPLNKKLLLDSLAMTARSLEFIVATCINEVLPKIKICCLVLNISGVDSGAYFYDQESKELQLIQRGHYHKLITDCLYIKSANIGLANYVVHFVGDLSHDRVRSNPKYYRIQQMLIGCYIEALTLAVSNQTITAHPYLGFNAKKIQIIYANKIEPNELPLGQVCVGIAKNDGRIEIPIR